MNKVLIEHQCISNHTVFDSHNISVSVITLSLIPRTSVYQ